MPAIACDVLCHVLPHRMRIHLMLLTSQRDGGFAVPPDADLRLPCQADRISRFRDGTFLATTSLARLTTPVRSATSSPSRWENLWCASFPVNVNGRLPAKPQANRCPTAET